MHCQSLERRRLLAVTAAVVDTTFRLDGTNAAEAVTLLITNTTATVTENGLDTDYSIGGVQKFRFFLAGGDDQLDITVDRTIAPTQPTVTIYGGAGDDLVTITDPVALDAYLLFGEDGDDTLQFAGNSSSAPRGQVTMYGGGGNDLLQGGNSRDLLDGGDGNDTLLGFGKQDVLLGGAGDDSLSGGVGNPDVLNGGPGADILIGSASFSLESDIFDPADLHDALVTDYDPQFDRLYSNPDAGDIAGFNPTDPLVVLNGDVLTVVGRSGVSGSAATSVISLVVDSSDQQTLVVTVPPLAEQAFAVSAVSQIRIYLGSDDDVMAIRNLPWTNLVTIYGGEGDDLVQVFATDDQPGPAGIRLPTFRFFGEDGNDRFETSDRLGRFYLYGGSGHDTLSAGTGGDLIDGGDGNDALSGGTGRDLLIGGAGNDRIDGGKAETPIPSNLYNDTLVGGPGDDVLNGWAGTDEISGGAGADLFDAAERTAGEVLDFEDMIDSVT